MLSPGMVTPNPVEDGRTKHNEPPPEPKLHMLDASLQPRNTQHELGCDLGGRVAHTLAVLNTNRDVCSEPHTTTDPLRLGG